MNFFRGFPIHGGNNITFLVSDCPGQVILQLMI